jgi:hypothetical protein
MLKDVIKKIKKLKEKKGYVHVSRWPNRPGAGSTY